VPPTIQASAKFHDFEEPIFKFAKPEVISNYMRILWQRLEVPFRKLNEQRWSLRPDSYLLGDECYLFWSGHSMRHVLAHDCSCIRGSEGTS